MKRYEYRKLDDSYRRRGARVASRSRRSGGRSLSDGRGRRSRRARPAGTLLLLVVAVTIGVVATYVYSRPLTAQVLASPRDAAIEFAGSSAASDAKDSLETTALARGIGSLEATGLPPGTYSVRVTRKGYASRAAVLEVKRFKRNSLNLVLKPAPQLVTVVAKPAGARISIVGDDGTKLTGTSKVSGKARTGRVTIACTRDGCNTYKRTFSIDAPLTLDVFLDPKGQQVHSVGTIATAGAPKGVMVRPQTHEAWATILNGPPSVEIFDVRTLKKTGEVDIGKYGAVEIEFTADGKLAYASQMETAKVFEIDAATRKVLREFDTKSAWTKVVELSPDEGTLYAANWSGDDVSEIDLATGELRRRIHVADTPRGLYATRDGKSLYVAGFGGGDLEKIDLATGEVKRLFKSGGALRHLVGDEKTQRLYASDMAKDCVYVCDMKTDEVTRFVGVDEKPNTIELSPDGRVLFVSCRGENNPKSYYIPGPEWGTILLFDALSGKPLDAVVGGNQCTALDVSDDGETLAFSDFLDDRLRVYDVPSYAKLAKGGGGRYKAHFAEIEKD